MENKRIHIEQNQKFVLNDEIFKYSLTKKGVKIIPIGKIENFYSFDMIVDCVCDVFNVTKKDILGKNSTFLLRYKAKYIITYLMRKHMIPKPAFEKIGEYLGGKHHTTIVYHFKKANRLKEKSPKFKHWLKLAQSKLTGRFYCK